MDINPADFAQCLYFRGSAMTQAHIDQIRLLSKKNPAGNMCLYGWTSTSRSKSVAKKFAYQDKSKGLLSVLLQIHWNDKTGHFYMNKSAFDYEDEILLYDGADYSVLSVQDPTHFQYKVNHKI